MCSPNQTAAAPAEKSSRGQIKPVLIMRVVQKIIISKIIGHICSSSPARHLGQLPDGDSAHCASSVARSGRPCSSMGED